MKYYIKAINTETNQSMIIETVWFTSKKRATEWANNFKNSFMTDVAEVEVVTKK